MVWADIAYLRTGDRFKAIKSRGRGKPGTVVYGVAAMDGHAVSPNYGRVVGSEHYINTPEAYINVMFDHKEYKSPYPNESIVPAKGWVVYVSREVGNRIKIDKAAEAHAERAAKAAITRAELDAKVRMARLAHLKSQEDLLLAIEELNDFNRKNK